MTTRAKILVTGILAVFIVAAGALWVVSRGQRARITTLSPEEVTKRIEEFSDTQRGNIYSEVKQQSGGVVVPEVSLTSHTAQTAVFTVPDAYKLRTEEEEKDSGKQRLLFTAESIGSRRLALVAGPAAALEDVPGFLAREHQPNKYTKSMQTVGGRTVAVFTETESGLFEKVLFSYDGVLGTSFALSSLTGPGSEIAEQEWPKMLETIQWQQ